MKESDFRRELKRSIRYYYPTSYVFGFPGMFIEGGLCDLYFCLNGKFTGVECKLVKELPKDRDRPILKYGFTELQAKRANDIRKAGGVSIGVICVRPLKTVFIVSDANIKPDFNFSTEDCFDMKGMQWDSKQKVWQLNKIKALGGVE